MLFKEFLAQRSPLQHNTLVLACEMGQVVTRSDRWIFSHVQNHTNVNAGANKNDLCNLFCNLNVK